MGFVGHQIQEDQKEKVEEFFKMNHYIRGSYDNPADFEQLNAVMVEKWEKKGQANRLFYLALPPSVY